MSFEILVKLQLGLVLQTARHVCDNLTNTSDSFDKSTWFAKHNTTPKKTKTQKIIDNFSDMLTLEGSGRNDTRSTLGLLLTNLGFSDSN